MKRVIFSFLAGAVIVQLAAVMLLKPAPRLFWNASASVPIGPYWIAPAVVPRLGDILAVRAPKTIACLMDERGYLPFNALLLKRVVGLSGTEICRRVANLFVAGKKIAQTKKIDS